MISISYLFKWRQPHRSPFSFGDFTQDIWGKSADRRRERTDIQTQEPCACVLLCSLSSVNKTHGFLLAHFHYLIQEGKNKNNKKKDKRLTSINHIETINNRNKGFDRRKKRQRERKLTFEFLHIFTTTTQTQREREKLHRILGRLQGGGLKLSIWKKYIFNINGCLIYGRQNIEGEN